MTYVDAVMVPLKSRSEEELEQALGVLWRLREEKSDDAARARGAVESRVGSEAYGTLLSRGLVEEKGGRVAFRSDGEKLAREVTRRHLLAERLLADLLDIRGKALEANACQWEHILSPEVTDSICALLGHPRWCPHGEPIPAGACCGSSAPSPAALLSPLSKLRPGESARVAYLTMPDTSLMHRLLTMGLTPGAKVKLCQTEPACVVQVGEATLALEPELAQGIVVRRPGA